MIAMRLPILGLALAATAFIPSAAKAQVQTQRGAAVGGLAGAVMGGLIGDKNNEAGAGAAIGGVVGAVTGGLLGNAADKELPSHESDTRVAHLDRIGGYPRSASQH